jgi:hypothetical protein
MRSRVVSSSSDIDSTTQKLLTGWSGGSYIAVCLIALGAVMKAESLREADGTHKQLLRLCPPSSGDRYFLGGNEIEYTQGGAARHKLQPLWYSRMRFMISVAFMPCPIACNIGPICHQPDFIRHVLWAEDIHPDKPCGPVDQVRTENESSLDLGIHVIGHDKSAQDANRLLFQLSNSSRKNFFCESTLKDDRQGDFPQNSDLDN